MDASKDGDTINASMETDVSGPALNGNVRNTVELQPNRMEGLQNDFTQLKEVLIPNVNASVERVMTLLQKVSARVEGMAYRLETVERNCNVLVDKVLLSDRTYNQPPSHILQTPIAFQPNDNVHRLPLHTATPTYNVTATPKQEYKPTLKNKQPNKPNYEPFVEVISDEDANNKPTYPQSRDVVTRPAFTTKYRNKQQLTQPPQSQVSKPLVARKLSLVNTRPIKSPKTETHFNHEDDRQHPRGLKSATSRLGTLPFGGQPTQKYTQRHVGTPKIVKTNFPVTPDMGLNQEQLQVFAYTFHPDRDPGEFIFKIGNSVGTRHDFQCLCPGRIVDQHIIKYMATKATWWQQNMEEQTLWVLPPSFAKDVGRRRTIKDLVDTYSTVWMPPFPDLKYIYVPIEEMGGAWYLMVVSIKELLVYHLDHYYEPQNVPHRHDKIRNLSEVIAQMTLTSCYPENFLDGVLDKANWDITEMGQFSDNYSNYSSIWVLHWMDMQWTFNPNQLQVVDLDSVRARVSVGLLLDEHNEFKSMLELNADLFWTPSSAGSSRLP